MMSFLTVFTPVYNRAYIISQLYESLCRQKCKDFEWLVVDDGSSDNIDEVINGFIAENKINIRYLKQSNGGKHRAINNGVKEAKGELFFIVDSDDYLTDDAVEWIRKESRAILNNTNFAGIIGCRCHKDLSPITKGFTNDVIDSDTLELRFKHHIVGDMAEVIKTNVLRNFPFPEVEGEKFCPEAMVWDKIAHSNYVFRVINRSIYFCEYLDDGLTSAIVKVRMKSPITSCLYYSQLSKLNIPIRQKFKAAINYWRFWFCKSFTKKSSISYKWIWTMPLGLLMHLKDKSILK